MGSRASLFCFVFLAAGWQGVPRRFAVHDAPWLGYAQIGTLAAVLVLLAALVLGVRLLARLPRASLSAVECAIRRTTARCRTRDTAAALIFAAGLALAHAVTDGFQAFTLESARRLHALTAPGPVPDLALDLADGGRARLSEMPGQVLLVDFVYTNCPTYCAALGSVYARLTAAPGGRDRRRQRCVWYRSRSIPRATARPSCAPTARATAADPAGLGPGPSGAHRGPGALAEGVRRGRDSRRHGRLHAQRRSARGRARPQARRDPRAGRCRFRRGESAADWPEPTQVMLPAADSPRAVLAAAVMWARARRASRARVAGGEHGVAHARPTAASRVDRLLHRPRLDALAPGRRRGARR